MSQNNHIRCIKSIFTSLTSCVHDYGIISFDCFPWLPIHLLYPVLLLLQKQLLEQKHLESISKPSIVKVTITVMQHLNLIPLNTLTFIVLSMPLVATTQSKG